MDLIENEDFIYFMVHVSEEDLLLVPQNNIICTVSQLYSTSRSSRILDITPEERERSVIIFRCHKG